MKTSTQARANKSLADHDDMPVLHTIVKREWPGFEAMQAQLRDHMETWHSLPETLDRLLEDGLLCYNTRGRDYYEADALVATAAGVRWYEAQLNWWS